MSEDAYCTYTVGSYEEGKRCRSVGPCEHSRGPAVSVQTEIKTVRSRCRTAIERVRPLIDRQYWPHAAMPGDFDAWRILDTLEEALEVLESYEDVKL